MNRHVVQISARAGEWIVQVRGPHAAEWFVYHTNEEADARAEAETLADQIGCNIITC